MDESSTPLSFDELGLHPDLVVAMRKLELERATQVQSLVIPVVIAGRDVRAGAETGSGKTLAFGLPLLHQMLLQPRDITPRGNPIGVLVLVPTRELAIQIADVLNEVLRHSDVAKSQTPKAKVLAVFGGVSANPQMMALRGGADILIATPGRLLDLHRQNAVDLHNLRVLVLDEADRMLGLGFQEELQEVLTLLPLVRQNLLFSATFPPDLEPIMGALLINEPLEVALPATDTLTLIEQHVFVTEQHRKYALLNALIGQRDLQQVLVFVSAKKVGDKVVEKLIRYGVTAAAFHADRSHAERQRVLRDFRAKRVRVLVATDLAGRGIDIEDLPTVINFELPRSPNDYTHRIGRTGRAGKPGLAISLICEAEYQHFGVIEKRIKRKFPREQLPGFELPSA